MCVRHLETNKLISLGYLLTYIIFICLQGSSSYHREVFLAELLWQDSDGCASWSGSVEGARVQKTVERLSSSGNYRHRTIDHQSQLVSGHVLRHRPIPSRAPETWTSPKPFWFSMRQPLAFGGLIKLEHGSKWFIFLSIELFLKYEILYRNCFSGPCQFLSISQLLSQL